MRAIFCVPVLACASMAAQATLTCALATGALATLWRVHRSLVCVHSVGPFCSPASKATPESPPFKWLSRQGCEVSPLLFSCCRRAVGRSKRQSCRVTTYGSCYEKIGPERLNETVSFEGDRREQCSSMPTGPSWSNSSKEAKEPRCLRAPGKAQKGA